MKDFKVITKAFQSSPLRVGGWDEGYIVEYEGELYFINHPDEGYTIDNSDFWTHDIERHWCFNEVDTDFYTYYRLDYKKIDVKGLNKK